MLRRSAAALLAGVLLTASTDGVHSVPGARQGSARGADQSVFVSKKVRGNNSRPVMAVNPQTGDVLVAWNRASPDFTSIEVWGALLKRKNSGKYRVRKPVLLSAKAGTNATPHVAWIPDNRVFLVVWNNANEVLGRIVNRRSGKPIGGINSVAGGGAARPFFARTSAIIEGGVQDVRLLYSRFVNTPVAGSLSNVGSELVEVRLSNRTLRSESEIFELAQSPDTLIAEEVLARALGCTLVLVTERDGVTGRLVRTSFDLYENGVLTDRVTARKGHTVLGARPLGGNRALVLVRDPSGDLELLGYSIDGLEPCTFSATGAIVFDKYAGENLYGDIAAVRVDGGLPLPLGAGPVGSLVAADDDGALYSQPLDEDLSALGERLELFRHKNRITAMTADTLVTDGSVTSLTAAPGPDAVVVWSRAVTASKQEIRAFLFRIGLSE